MSLEVARPARYVGARVQRVEDKRLLLGRGRYVDDLAMPRVLHAAFVRSPHAHARIVSVDVADALALDGVVAVYTGRDLAEEVGEIVSGGADGVPALGRPALVVDRAKHVGDPVALVIARTPYLAEDGRDLVRVEWEPLPAVLDVEQAVADGAVVLDEGLGTNSVAQFTYPVGDVEQVFADAAHVFTKRFQVGRSTAAPIETRGIVAEWDEGSGRMTVWASTQMPHRHRSLLAPALRISEGALTVIAPDVGGGFGLKCHLLPEDVAIPAAARLLGQPVKWIEDRFENLAAGVHSKEMLCEIALAVDEDGRFTGIRGSFVSDGGAYSVVPWTSTMEAACAATMLPSVYDIQTCEFSMDGPLTNKCTLGAVRGVGWVSGQLAREVLVDEVARELGADPVELRLKNMIGPEPYTSAFGAAYDGGSYAASLQAAADALDHAGFRERQAAARREGRHIGIGYSPFVEPTGLGTRSVQQVGGTETYFDAVRLTIEPDGSVVVSTGMHSHGQGHETTFAQIAADELGVRLEDVRVSYGSTDSAVYGMGTYSSRSAVIAMGGIKRSSEKLRDRLLRIAADKLEASAEDIELYDGKASIKGAPERFVDFAELAAFAYFGGDARPEDVQSDGLTAVVAHDQAATYANGTVGVIVEVDVETGMVRIDRLVAVEDCGVMINPMVVDGQVAGAVANGIGIALLEELVYADDGQFLSGSLMDYLYPSTTEVPDFEIQHIETPSAFADGGVKGAGEAGTIGTPPAILNAIADALSEYGVRIDRAPVTPSYLRDLLREAGA